MTRRLHALRVGNFKAFADTQRIPIKPITLVFGPNSAGKSSFIHSLALAHEANFGREKQGRARLDVHHTAIGGSAIDLGGFRQFVHRGQFRKRVEWGAELNVASLSQDKQFKQVAQILAPVQTVRMTLELGIELDKYDKPVAGAEPRVEAVQICGDDEELLHMFRGDRAGTALRIDRLNTDHPVFRQILQAIVETTTTSSEFRAEDFAGVNDAIGKLLSELVVISERFLPSTVELAKAEASELSPASMLFPISRGNRGEDIAQAVRFVLPRRLTDLIKGLADVLGSELARLQYLGPIRTVPPRHVVFQQHQDENWGSGGNFAWELLRRENALREKVNQWLGGHPGLSATDVALDQMQDTPQHRQWMKTPFRLEVAHFYSASDLRDPLIKTFLDRPLTLIERRQLLTKELVEVMSELQDQYEMKQSRIEDEVALLRPWIEQIQAARSNEDRERLLEQAWKSLSGTSELATTWEEIRVEQQIEQLPYDDATKKAWEFVQELEEQGVSDIAELRLVDVRKRTAVSLRDVGVGISQVLPVLALAYGSRQKLIAIEQPEIHLHPALQAELGDVFIESALGECGNTFILETHSEHLILRLMKRMRETHLGKGTGLPPVTPADIAVLYFEPDGTRSIVREMPLNEMGELVKSWPGGFFEEGLREQFGDA